jgi:predicted MPP superfamily phosphohydrolase
MEKLTYPVTATVEQTDDYHGGQLGLAGKSALILTGRIKYPWGIYRQGDCRLYTSAGAGQWLPFRLGCPAEAPILELAGC